MRLRVLIVPALLAACGGGDKAPESSASSSPAPAAQVAKAVSYDPASITPAMIALGDSIFHGKIGASSCQACHGIGGKDGTAAPDLTDGDWLHSDGSFEGIANTIKTGVMAPKQAVGVMPPYGGVMLPDDRLQAVAAYVYTLSHQ
jgi:mono/diheme cytochrome c family protein